MKRSAPMRRTPMPRGTAGLQRTAMRPRSKRPSPVGNPARWEAWQSLREAVYARAAGQCERCGRDLEDAGLECHHRKLRSQGGRDELSNLAALCRACHHDEVHAHPTRAQTDGWIVRQRSIPAQVAVVLWSGETVRLCDDGTYDVCWDTRAGEAA